MKPLQRAIDYAVAVSTLSPCRSKRGAAIFHEGSLYGGSYNHKPPGFVCDGSLACKANCSKDTVHAEQGALLKVGIGRSYGSDMLHVKTIDGQLVPSGEPSCLHCSKVILDAGICKMWLYHEDGWRAYSAHEFHLLSGAYVPEAGS